MEGLELERELDNEDYSTESKNDEDTGNEHLKDLELAQTGECHNIFTHQFE
jgi:hypothetical protein